MAAETPFEIAWGHVIRVFATADTLGAAAAQYAAHGNYETAFAKMNEAETLARSVPELWAKATSGNRIWAALDEPLRAFAASYAQTARAARADVASVVAGSKSNIGVAVTAILLRETSDAARSLTTSARELSASLGGDPARISALGMEG